MFTHNQCFEQKLEKHHNFSAENYRFYSREKLQYTTRPVFVMSVANLRKTKIYKTSIDLKLFTIQDDEHTKFGLILSINSQEKTNSDINQGP